SRTRATQRTSFPGGRQGLPRRDDHRPHLPADHHRPRQGLHPRHQRRLRLGTARPALPRQRTLDRRRPRLDERHLPRSDPPDPPPARLHRPAHPHRQDRSGTTQMTIALRYAAYSDVGCLREGNEDSGYAGPNLLVVADGMGGRAGGEIASSLAVHSLIPLDEDMPGHQMVRALEDAVAAANEALARKVIQEPHLGNMGTTLSAMLWSGARMVLV